MEDRSFDKAKRAAKRKRDQTIRAALRATGKRPKQKDRRLDINVEFVTLDDYRKAS